MEEKEIQWRAAEYEHSEKARSWFVWVIVISFAISIFGFFKRNFFFGTFALIAGGMIIMFARRRPQIFDFTISEKGIFVGNAVTLSYDQIENFAIRSRPGHLDEIVLKKKSMINPFVHIPIDSELAIKAREILKEKLPEEEHNESIIDIIFDYIGF
jgi:hypothetical protein